MNKQVQKSTKRKVRALPKPPGYSQALISIEPQALIRAAIDNKAPVDIMERLFSLRERLQKEAAERAYRESMAILQAEFPVISKKQEATRKKKGTTNDERVHFYNYAPIEDIVSAKNKKGKTVAELISKHGFSYSTDTKIKMNEQATKESRTIGVLEAIVKITHVMGHNETSTFTGPISSNEYISDLQAAGAANTFCMRYAFKNGFGIITGKNDNDGNLPEGKEGKKKADQKEKKGVSEIDAKKLKDLPDYLTEGFRIQKYSVGSVIAFGERFNWDHKVMRRELDKIADAGDPENIKNAGKNK